MQFWKREAFHVHLFNFHAVKELVLATAPLLFVRKCEDMSGRGADISDQIYLAHARLYDKYG